MQLVILVMFLMALMLIIIVAIFMLILLVMLLLLVIFGGKVGDAGVDCDDVGFAGCAGYVVSFILLFGDASDDGCF
jgi:hypothetical protein